MLFHHKILGEYHQERLKGLGGYENWESLVSQFVSPHVLEQLKEKNEEKIGAQPIKK